MILLRCNGRVLEARRVGRVVARVGAEAGVPIKAPPWRILEDEDAYAELRALFEDPMYTRDFTLQDDKDYSIK